MVDRQQRERARGEQAIRQKFRGVAVDDRLHLLPVHFVYLRVNLALSKSLGRKGSDGLGVGDAVGENVVLSDEGGGEVAGEEELSGRGRRVADGDVSEGINWERV
jgi:hypothetical protein